MRLPWLTVFAATAWLVVAAVRLSSGATRSAVLAAIVAACFGIAALLRLREDGRAGDGAR